MQNEQIKQASCAVRPQHFTANTLTRQSVTQRSDGLTCRTLAPKPCLRSTDVHWQLASDLQLEPTADCTKHGDRAQIPRAKR